MPIKFNGQLQIGQTIHLKSVFTEILKANNLYFSKLF